MKKFRFKLFSALVVLLTIVWAAPAFSGYDHYTIDVKYDRGTGQYNPMGYSVRSTGIMYYVLTAGSDTLATLYSDSGLTSKTNPVTTTVFAVDGKIDFYIADTATTVDIIAVDTNGGYTTFMDGIDQNTHLVIMDERPNVLHHGVARFIYDSDAGANDIDTGINFEYDTAVLDVRVEVVTVDAGMTIDVGLLSTELTTEPNLYRGFRSAVSVATAGYVSSGTGAAESMLLNPTIDAEWPNNNYAYIIHGTGPVSLTYRLTAAADTAVGWIHFFFVRLR